MPILNTKMPLEHLVIEWLDICQSSYVYYINKNISHASCLVKIKLSNYFDYDSLSIVM